MRFCPVPLLRQMRFMPKLFAEEAAVQGRAGVRKEIPSRLEERSRLHHLPGFRP